MSNYCTAAAKVVVEVTIDYRDTIQWEDFLKLRDKVYSGKIASLIEKQLLLGMNLATEKLTIKEKSAETWLC